MKSLTDLVLDLYRDDEDEVTEAAKLIQNDATIKCVEALKHGIWFVRFVKADGTETTMECTLDEKIIPLPLTESGNFERTRNTKPGTIAVYSLDRNGWRSFVLSRVKEFTKKPQDI